MKEQDESEFVFPQDTVTGEEGGMTKRELISALLLGSFVRTFPSSEQRELCITRAIDYADALLAHLRA